MNKTNEMLQDIFEEVMSNNLGGDINSEACEFGTNYIKIHCWDGRRYMLTCSQEPDGCKYDAETGNPIV